MTVVQLAGQLGRPASFVSRAENEKSWLAGADLAACASVLNVTEELLATSMPERAPECVRFRSDAVSKLVQDQLIQHANFIGWVLNRLHEHTVDEVVHPRYVPQIDVDLLGGPEGAARVVRALWGMRGPSVDIAQQLEGAGVMILPMPTSGGQVDAISVRASGPVFAVVLLNQAMSHDRQRRALAHELGHLVMNGARRDSAHRDERDDQGDRFAAEWLAPGSATGPVRPRDAGRFLQALREKRYSSVDISRAVMTQPSELQNIFGEHWPFGWSRPLLTVIRTG